MEIDYRLADQSDLSAIIEVGDTLFDHPVKEERAEEFLMDARHHLFLAYHQGEIVGMASGFHYVHPDKDPELFLNEVGVVDMYQNQGIGRVLVRKMVEYGRDQLGCKTAWVLTDHSNERAKKMYLAAGGKVEEGNVVMIGF